MLKKIFLKKVYKMKKNLLELINENKGGFKKQLAKNINLVNNVRIQILYYIQNC